MIHVMIELCVPLRRLGRMSSVVVFGCMIRRSWRSHWVTTVVWWRCHSDHWRQDSGVGCSISGPVRCHSRAGGATAVLLRCYCGATAVLLRCYCGATAVLLRCYCGATAVLLRCYCGATGVLLRCYCGATAVLLRCYCGATAVLLRCYCGATAVLLRCYCGATAVLLRCYCGATAVLLRCYCGATAVLLRCYCGATAVLLRCYCGATAVLLRCYCGATAVLLRCYCGATAVLLRCYCGATAVLLRCYCGATAVLLRCYCGATVVLLRCYCGGSRDSTVVGPHNRSRTDMGSPQGRQSSFSRLHGGCTAEAWRWWRCYCGPFTVPRRSWPCRGGQGGAAATPLPIGPARCGTAKYWTCSKFPPCHREGSQFGQFSAVLRQG